MTGKIKTEILILFFIVLLSIITYSNSLRNPFHFDDTHHIIDNPYLKSLRHIPDIFTDTRAFSVWEGNNRHYRPLLLLTHSINYAIGGLNPAGYRLVNLAFHAGSAFLIFLIVQAMLGSSKEAAGSRVKGFSTTYYLLPTTYYPLASALIFAVHPFNSEVVNYISARSSVMSAFFYLLSFYCWVKYRQAAGGIKGTGSFSLPTTYYLLPTTSFYISSLLAFLAGMLTKEIVITLPIILWFYDHYFLPEKNGKGGFANYVKGFIIYTPFLLLVAFPYVVVRSFLVERSGGISYSVLPRGYYENLLMEIKVLVKYIQLWLVPYNLSVEHTATRVFTLLEWEFLLSTGFIVGLLALTLWLFYKRNNRICAVVSFFIVWYLVVLLPVMFIPLNAVLQENRGYLAGVTLAVVAGVVIGHALKPFPGWAGICVLISILIFYSTATIARNRVWKDDLTLWSDAARKSPLSARAHHYLALTYNEMGETGKAIVEYQKALMLEEGVNKALIHNNLGSLYGRLKLWDLAIYEYRMTIEINPNLHMAYNNIGTIYMIRGDMEKAAEKFKEALRIYPGYSLARINLEKTYKKRHEPDNK